VRAVKLRAVTSTLEDISIVREGDSYAISVTTSGFVPVRSCRTRYPPALIELIHRIKGSAYLCDEIAREESPSGLRTILERALLSFLDKEALTGRRLLDFGCGGGASTMILARLLLETSIVGVELSNDFLSIARARQKFYGYRNVEFLKSPSGEALPSGIGKFDAIVMSAVFEHLLPQERKTLMPLLWTHLSVGGTLLIGQTPHRWYPIEDHTTGIPLLNYVPDFAAKWAANRLSRRALRNDTWPTLLRKGIRGGSEREVLRLLPSATVLTPRGFQSRADHWFAALSPRHRLSKKAIRGLLRASWAVLGIMPSSHLLLALYKAAETPAGEGQQ
jgi:2-polyprenyl-3-methyl-5-hydroxy-6-metoxy-1,4-benzoquinol methylase